MRIALAGATGLVGSLLLRGLIEAGHEVHAFQRRPSGASSALLQRIVAPPAEWPHHMRDLALDAAVSALGTTIRQAGSRTAFASVDRDLAIDFARAARAAGAVRFVAISSVGADPRSRNFYLRIKGEAEQGFEPIGFGSLHLLRPGLLLGERGGERRIAEAWGARLAPLLNLVLRGPLDSYAAIPAADVAKAAARLMEEGGPGIHVHHNRALVRLARTAPLQITGRLR